MHPWNRSPRDDAELIEVSVPTTMTVGSTATAAVVLYNSGNTVWNPQNGYRLGSNDNLTWGVNRVDLGERIHPGQQARFDIPITAPTQAGRVSFVWQMLRDGGTWFGESAGPVVITVTPPAEPAECLSLRDRIAAIDQTISQLADAPDDDPRLSAQTRRQIQELRSQRGELVQQAQALGCTL